MIFSSHTRSRRTIAGFTLIELLVSIGIFVFMTALLVAKYGNFNNSVLLTDAAYDIALSIRQAQTYGLSVQGSSADYADPEAEKSFNREYGLSFNLGYGDSASCHPPSASTFYMFTNSVSPSVALSSFSCTSPIVNVFNLKRGAHISGVCFETSGTCSYRAASIVVFTRPDPSARFSAPGSVCNYDNSNPTAPPNCIVSGVWDIVQANSMIITISSADNSETRTIQVYRNGQIAVGN